MKEILKELDSAYAILQSISVSYDGVQKMAAAQLKLQKIYAKLAEGVSVDG